jgi:ankyrin repeat protein
MTPGVRMGKEVKTNIAVLMVMVVVLGLSNTAYALVPPKEPLLMAVLEGNQNKVKELIDSGADVNKVDERYGCTALHLAAREGRLEIVKVLRKAGAKIYAENTNKEPLLFAAAYSGSTNVLKFLVDEGATTKGRNSEGKTLLHYAILFRQAGMAKYLIRLGLDVKAVDKKGWSPLHEAAYVGDVTIIEDLAKAGANVNATNWHKETPLHFAAVYGHTNSVRELLKVNADPNLLSDQGDTPLIQALQSDSPEIVALLLQAKADPNIGNNCKYTPLSGAVSLKKWTPIVKLLVSGGADVNKRIDHRRTAIFNVIPDDNVEMFLLLVESGADLTVKDDSGETPMDWIKQYNAKRIGDFLAGRSRPSKAK